MATLSIDRTTQRYSSGPQARPDTTCIHTTEGMSWPSYGGGAYPPHSTIRPLPGVGITVREHIDPMQYAKALENRAGGVETNTLGVFQVELMGTCDPKHKDDPVWYFWPEADDVVLQALADYLRPIHAQYGIPATSSVKWLAYPSSYGSKSGQRLSFEDWLRYSGILGHQHIPENDHGDPGLFPIDKLIKLLGGSSNSYPVPVKPAPKPVPVPAAKAPAYPLGKCRQHGFLCYYGPRSGPDHSVSGYFGGRQGLILWQARMRARGWVNSKGLPLVADGYYGDETARVAKLFQQQCRIQDDSLIGVDTYRRAWTQPIT